MFCVWADARHVECLGDLEHLALRQLAPFVVDALRERLPAQELHDEKKTAPLASTPSSMAETGRGATLFAT